MGPLSRLFLPSHTALCIKSFLSSPKKTDSVLHGDERNDLMHRDRKSTRLNSSHGYISYAVFCLKKKNVLTTMTGNDAPAAFAPVALHETSPGLAHSWAGSVRYLDYVWFASVSLDVRHHRYLDP